MAFTDCSSLFHEQKLNAFIKKRRKRIARKVLSKWRVWAQLQREKEEFFSTVYTSSPLRRKRLHNNNDIILMGNEDEIRLAVALADTECERLKSFWATKQIYNGLEDERQLSWCESLAERSSGLLDYFDEETLEAGIEIARRNIRLTDSNGPKYNRCSDGLTCNFAQQQIDAKNIEIYMQNKTNDPPTKKKCKDVEYLVKRFEDFTKELDDAFTGMKERNRRYDEILKSSSSGD